MADMLDGGVGGEGMVGQFPLEQWFYEMPICTRIWTVATLAMSVLVQCRVLTALQLFYSVRAVFIKNQFWRLLTNFLYFGPLSVDLLLHIYFLQRYSRLLEESSGRSPAAYTWLIAYAASFLLILAPFVDLIFLGQPLSSVLVYIWSRRNPDARLSLLGLMTFRAPFLPWVLVGFSVVLNSRVPKDEMCGIIVGHIYYFFSDIFPPMYDGYRPLDPPRWWIRLFDGPQRHHSEDELNEDDGTTARNEIEGVHLGRTDLAAAPAPDVQ